MSFDVRRLDSGSSAGSQGAVDASPGKRPLIESQPVQLAREVSHGGKLPPPKPGAKLPTSMLAHMGSVDGDREFDDGLPVEVLAANALAHGMLGASVDLPFRAEVE